jgi:hypothetical protein
MAIRQSTDILNMKWVCSVDGFLNLFCITMELYTLMCIALDRYFSIKKQTPLTLNQVIGLLVFGYFVTGLIYRYFHSNDS